MGLGGNGGRETIAEVQEKSLNKSDGRERRGHGGDRTKMEPDGLCGPREKDKFGTLLKFC